MQPCNSVDGVYSVIQYQKRIAINGQEYLRISLANAFESVTANCWLNNYTGPDSFTESEAIHIVGKRKKLDVKEIIDIYQANRLNTSGAWSLVVIPHCRVANNADLLRLIQLVDDLSSEQLQNFVYEAFSDRNFASLFCNLPASHQFHHSFAGGLLRHSLECASIVAQCPALSPLDRDLGTVAALFHDAGKVLTMKDAKKTQLGYLVDHDSLTLSTLHHPLQKLDSVWPDAAIALRHIWTCRSHKKWGYKAKMPVATVVQMADQISSNINHESQAFFALPGWRNSATHSASGERFWRLSEPFRIAEHDNTEARHG